MALNQVNNLLKFAMPKVIILSDGTKMPFQEYLDNNPCDKCGSIYKCQCN